MMFYGNNVGIVPLTDAAGITQPFKPGKHYGVDIGWNKQHNCDVLAWQDGKVVAKGYYSDTGYYVALEHTYATTKRWSVYIHLASGSTSVVSVGQAVKLGQKIGKRGNTGHSSGEHLHLYLTSEITKALSFNFTNLKKYAVNPVPYLYYSKEYNTIYISKDWTKPLPDPIPEVVQPVDRDLLKDQLICHEDDLRVRAGAGISKTVIGHLLKDKYYNWFAHTPADGYEWYKLADNQWCAKIDSVDILPRTEIVQPVERDSSKDQLTCSISNLRVRASASLKGQQLGFLKADVYYNWFEKVDADGYTWLKLAENQYCAKVEEVTLLPKVAYYTAVEGDTLESIAKQFNISIEQIVALNPQLVEAGDVIRVA